jgi:molybdenum cofactor biosynthesis protein B
MRIAVLTVSTSRYHRYGDVADPNEADDLSGEVILRKISSAGHDFTYCLVPDGIEPLRSVAVNRLEDALVICGGTGLSPQDLTIEAMEPLYEKSIPGFGEIFRLKSLEQVGSRAMLTRASAGVIRGVPVFCIPGSPLAAELGTDLILAELDHILTHIRSG